MVVAQLAEQSLPIPEVSGSNPVVVVTQLAERSLPIPKVSGSNPVSVCGSSSRAVASKT